MINLRNLFRKKNGYPVQIYGKLPFYKDYIAVVTTPAAMKWRDFLLSTFGQEGAIVPQGLWPYLFQGAPGHGIIAGLIEPGSDGLRKFPFSIFVDLNLKRVGEDRQWPLLLDIFHELKGVHAVINASDSIDTCYETLPALIAGAGTKGGTAYRFGGGSLLQSLVAPAGAAWPLIWGVFPGENRLFFLGDARTPSQELIRKWKGI